MGFANSVDADIRMVASNDPRSVILYRRTADDTYAAGVTITHVVRENTPDGAMTSASGVVLPKSDAGFHLQASQVGAAPNPGDRLKDLGDNKYYDLDTIDERGEGTWFYVEGVLARGTVVML